MISSPMNLSLIGLPHLIQIDLKLDELDFFLTPFKFSILPDSSPLFVAHFAYTWKAYSQFVIVAQFLVDWPKFSI